VNGDEMSGYGEALTALLARDREAGLQARPLTTRQRRLHALGPEGVPPFTLVRVEADGSRLLVDPRGERFVVPPQPKPTSPPVPDVTDLVLALLS
jgi:hypothetical protein